MTEPLSDAQLSEMVEMAWCDKTSFEDIQAHFGLSEGEVIAQMRRAMKPSSFRMWRKRVSGRTAKHKTLSKTGRSL